MFKVVHRYRDGEQLEVKFSNFYMANCYVESLIYDFTAHHDRKRNCYRITYFNENIADLKSTRISKK